jgi:hypothetical protein
MPMKKIAEKELLHTLQYFAIFQYAPTFEEIYAFLRLKITKKDTMWITKELISKKKVIFKENRYTIGEYGKNIDTTIQRQNISQQKIGKLQKVIRILQWVPPIQFIGLSGSMSMNNAEEEADVDLFIITRQERLWLTRLLSLVLLQIFGVRRKRKMNKKIASNTLCLNLFFDEKDLALPTKKHTEYAAHEVLQMKPIYNKNNTYERFLTVNSWVYDIFPNAEKNHVKTNHKTYKNIKKSFFVFQILGNLFEQIARKIQLAMINKHKTKEYITETQLWFFPVDYEQKVKRKLK